MKKRHSVLGGSFCLPQREEALLFPLSEEILALNKNGWSKFELLFAMRIQRQQNRTVETPKMSSRIAVLPPLLLLLIPLLNHSGKENCSEQAGPLLVLLLLLLLLLSDVTCL